MKKTFDDYLNDPRIKHEASYDRRAVQFTFRFGLDKDEDRYISFGCFHDTVILAGITTDEAEGNTQIITAREAMLHSVSL